MASTHSTPNQTDEYCSSCETERSHRISIDLVTESDNSENASFSREPYRIATCMNCGTESRTRMNDA